MKTVTRIRGCIAALVWSFLPLPDAPAAPAATWEADVVVVGGTPAGIAAAIAAAREGRTALLLERTAHIGGLPANGLGATDIVTRGATAGLFLEFVRRVRAHYVAKYGADSPQVRDCSDGYWFEPQVAERVLEEMLASQPAIRVLKRRQFDSEPQHVSFGPSGISDIRILARDTGAIERVCGRVFVDATYEGDLAAAAGAEYRVGREDAREFKEPMAGRLYKAWQGEVGSGSDGRGDNAVQAYNFRLPLTRDTANRVPITRPADYRREEYASLIDDLRADRHTGPAGAIRRELAWDGIGRVVNMKVMPNGKTDANNQHASFLSTDLPEENWPWPTSSWDWRDRFEQRLRDYTLGLLWFCQNDPELPADFRERCAAWGLAKDEYTDNGHFPRQVYVREGRRIVGEHWFTAHDALPVAAGARPPVHPTSITASHYALDSHAVRKREPGRVHLDGFFGLPTVPYTVPYGVIVPKTVEGLLVPVAASATHIGFSTLRMEPCWMALGEAAGVAAALALETQRPLRKVETARLQATLLRHGGVLVYFRDLAPGHPGYAAAQTLALRGVMADWTARPSEPATASDVALWREVLQVPPEAPQPVSGATRGDVFRALSAALAARPL